MTYAPLPRRIRRTDRPGFRNEVRNVPAMRPAPAPVATLVRPATARTYDPPRYDAAPADGPTWEVLALSADGSTAPVAVGTFAHCADVAAARGRHPSAGSTRFAVVPVALVAAIGGTL